MSIQDEEIFHGVSITYRGVTNDVMLIKHPTLENMYSLTSIDNARESTTLLNIINFNESTIYIQPIVDLIKSSPHFTNLEEAINIFKLLN